MTKPTYKEWLESDFTQAALRAFYHGFDECAKIQLSDGSHKYAWAAYERPMDDAKLQHQRHKGFMHGMRGWESEGKLYDAKEGSNGASPTMLPHDKLAALRWFIVMGQLAQRDAGYDPRRLEESVE